MAGSPQGQAVVSNAGATATVRVNRRREFEAFDELPKRLRDLMNDLPLHHSAIDVRALLTRTPADIIEDVLRREAAKHLATYRRRIAIDG